MPAKNAQLSELNGTYSEGHCGGIFQIAVGKKILWTGLVNRSFLLRVLSESSFSAFTPLFMVVSSEVKGNEILGGQQIGPPGESVIPCQVRTIFFQSSPQPSSIGSLKALLSMQRAIQGRPALYLLQWNVAVPGHCQVQLMTTLRFFFKTHFMLRKCERSCPWAPLCPTPWWCPL